MSVPQHVDSCSQGQWGRRCQFVPLALSALVLGRNGFILQKLKPQTSGLWRAMHGEDYFSII